MRNYKVIAVDFDNTLNANENVKEKNGSEH